MVWIAHQESRLLVPLERGARSERHLGDLFLVCATLAAVVGQSYARMAHLARALSERTPEARGLEILSRELQAKAMEPAFHAEVFAEIASWMWELGSRSPQSARKCMERLAALLPRITSAADQSVPSAFRACGLSRLFVRHQSSVPG